MGRLYYAIGSILFVDLGFGGRVIEALRSPGGALWANASFEILGLIGLLMIVMAMRLSDSSRHSGLQRRMFYR